MNKILLRINTYLFALPAIKTLCQKYVQPLSAVYDSILVGSMDE